MFRSCILKYCVLLQATALLTACASSPAPLVTVVQPARPAVTAAEAVQFRCAPAPRLAAVVPDYDELLAHALTLRSAYDDCSDLNGRLLDLATRVPGAPPAAPTGR